MIALEKIPPESSLIDETLADALKDTFSALKEPVLLRAALDPETEKGKELAGFLRKITSLSDRLSLELYTPEEAKAAAPELSEQYLPVTGLYRNGVYGRAAFHGIPGGKEINAFVLAICYLSGLGKPLPEESLARIRGLKKDFRLLVCVSLACHHCQNLVTACQRIAILSPHVQADMADAVLYKDLIDRYQITRVPLLIINEKTAVPGGKTLDEVLDILERLSA